jgi:peptide/nickel transport system substrate-binding protein
MPERGGTLRVVVPADDTAPGWAAMAPDLFDTALGWTSFANSYAIHRCCLSRTLMSYNGRPTEEGGARLQPDIAAALPDVSADGLTWTFRLQEGLRYGPPLEDVEVTAQDFIRSFHRLLAPAIDEVAGASYEWYPMIQGVTEYAAGAAASIAGLESPDDHTLVIRLTEPSGDLGQRVATPMLSPIPPNPSDPGAAFGIAEGADGGYGRFLVASGPYMFEGSEAIDFSVPVADRASPSGLAAGSVVLVRNPSWDAASDPLRPAYADRIEIAKVPSVDAAVAALDAGEADLLWPIVGTALPSEVYAAFDGHPERGRVSLHNEGGVRYLLMDRFRPPFDDIHVRKAASYAIDKQHLVDLGGGPAAYGVAPHLVNDAYEDGLLADYDPYATPGHRGDLAAARAEIAQSAYDTDGDGRCDAEACAHVRLLTRGPFGEAAAAVAGDLEPLGMTVDVEVVEAPTFFDTYWSAAEDPAITIPLYFAMGFKSALLSASDVLSSFEGIPGIRERSDACRPLVGTAQFQCWAALDQYLMEQTVPAVPYARNLSAAISSPRVTTTGSDEYSGTIALDQLALRQ